MEELQGFLTNLTPQAVANPNNPLAQDADNPSANPANPLFNPSNPGAWNNPSNPQMNPNLPTAVNNPANPEFNPNMPGAQNNPSNPSFNPAYPSAMNNPSNPELNPSYPGSITNPSNPIHNPSFPAPSDIPPPPGLSPDASLPPSKWSSLNEDPSLGWGEWRPGKYGKGVMDTEGNVYHWSLDQPFVDAYPNHNDWIDHALVPAGGQAAVRFTIEPDGQIWEMNAEDGVYPEDREAILNAHPRFHERETLGRVAAWQEDYQCPNCQQPLFYNGHTGYSVRDGNTWRPVGFQCPNCGHNLKDTPPQPLRESAWKFADHYTQDTREWPDPTEPRASEAPAPKGCTCPEGHKLDCPIHGMNGDDSIDHSWSYPENQPVGYPQDQPRGWVDAYQGAWTEWIINPKTADITTPMGYGTMYHVAPRSKREQILQQGLQGQDQQESPWQLPWAQPRGNYLFDNPEDAGDYVYTLHGRQTGGDPGDQGYNEDQWVQPEPPEDFDEWDPDRQDEWYENNDPVEATDDPNGYDIWQVQSHGLPMGVDPESRLQAEHLQKDPKMFQRESPYWDLGRLHEWGDPEDTYDPWGTMRSDYGEEPKRYHVPVGISPSRVQLYQHVPTWSLDSEDADDRLENSYERQVPSPWMMTPMTEWTFPGHESKTATLRRVPPPRPRPSKFVTTLDDHKRGKAKHIERKLLSFPKPKRSAMYPHHLQDWIKQMGPYLYHVTSPEAKESILKEGLYPHDVPRPGEDGESRSKWKGQFFAPRPGHVYMGTERTAMRNAGHAFGGGKIKIDLRKLDPKKMNPDEDFFHEHYDHPLAQQVNEFDPIPSAYDYDPGAGQGISLGDWADRANLGENPEETAASLERHGSLAYNGVIPPEAMEDASDVPAGSTQPKTPEEIKQTLGQPISINPYDKSTWPVAASVRHGGYTPEMTLLEPPRGFYEAPVASQLLPWGPAGNEWAAAWR